MKDLFEREFENENSKLLATAQKLAVLFSEEKNIPSQYRKDSDKQKKANDDTQVMNRFKAIVNIWKNVISKIIEKVEPNMAWRFINLKPIIEENTKSAAYNRDFIDFTDYFVLRRDIENCDDDELGCLALLYTGFQRTIEKELNKSKPDFVAVDFEHATREKGTICSVGIVSFKNGEIIDKFDSLVQPPNNDYEWFTTKQHKLNSLSTKEAPSFVDVFPEIYKRLNNNIVVAHGAFHTDKACLEQAICSHNIDTVLNITWVCTHQICDCGLDIACKVCNIDFTHHDALSDAIGCGILYSKYLKGDLPVKEFQKFKSEAKALGHHRLNNYPKQLTGDILKPDFESAQNKTNPFFMKKVVISGLCDDEKETIANELKAMGADVDSSVGNKTNFLIAGDNVGPSKLSKMQANIAEGRDAQIISLSEFYKLKNESYSS